MKARFLNQMLVLGGAVATLVSCSLSSTIERTPGFLWTDSTTLSEAIVEAEEAGKIVFIDFYADWCTPCKMMDEDVYSNETLGTYFNQNFVNLKVDGEKGNGPNLAYLYKVKTYPVLLFVDYNGRELARKDGAAYHSELKRLAQTAIKTHQSR